MREGRGANGIGGGSWADHCIGSIGNVERGVGVIHRKAHSEKEAYAVLKTFATNFETLPFTRQTMKNCVTLLNEIHAQRRSSIVNGRDQVSIGTDA